MSTIYTKVTELACPDSVVWDFLIHPANILAVSPPELNLQLLEGPPVLQLGARIKIQGKRWGFSQTTTNQVTTFTPNTLMVDEQVEGPFRKFRHQHRLEATATGTRMTDEIEFETPGGLLGMIVTVSAVKGLMDWAFDYRTKKFAEILGKIAT